MGNHQTKEKTIDGKTKTETLYYKIPAFELMNQDSQIVSNETLAGKIYVADFFFSYCPDICIPMKNQMLRINEKFKGNNQLKLISHTLDPQHDSIPYLKKYAQKLGANTQQWNFVTAKESTIYQLAKAYMALAERNENAPGGIAHSGHFILVDPKGHIRGAYDGTQALEVDQLMQDIEILLDEKP